MHSNHLVLLATFLAFFVSLARPSPDGAISCTRDITEASIQIIDATNDIAKATVDCGSNASGVACAQDISAASASLALASEDINNAVTDCGGEGSQCAADISECAYDLSEASFWSAAAAGDCAAGNVTSCTYDIAEAAKYLTLAGIAIGDCVSDC